MLQRPVPGPNEWLRNEITTKFWEWSGTPASTISRRLIASLRLNFIQTRIPETLGQKRNSKSLARPTRSSIDENKRSAYDRYGHAAFGAGAGAGVNRGAGGFHDPFDIFREVFGMGAEGGGGGIFDQIFGSGVASRDRSGRQRGSDLRYDLQITLEEAAFGTEKEIEILKHETCTSCSGSGAESGLSCDLMSDLSGSRPGHYFAWIFPGFPDLPALSRNRSGHRPALPGVRRRRQVGEEVASQA